MTIPAQPTLLPPARLDPLRLAAAAYLARFKGQSRVHTESDLRAYLMWCAERGVDPLATTRPYIELYVRWMQEQRRLAASTVSRRVSVVIGFYRTCVIDAVLEHSPAEYVRRPTVPAQSPTLGLSHLQFEAMLAAARDSANPTDFALVCLLGLLGLRISEATGLNVSDLGEEHGHRVLRVVGKGHKIVLVPMPPAVARAVDRAIGDRHTGRSCSTAPAPDYAADPPPPGYGGCKQSPACRSRGCTRTCCATPSSPPCSTPASTCATPRSPPATPTPARRCATTEPVPTLTGTRTTSSPRTCPPAHDGHERAGHADERSLAHGRLAACR